MDTSAYLQLLQEKDLLPRIPGIGIPKKKKLSPLQERIRQMLEKSNIQLEFNDDGMAIINYEQFGKILKNLDNAVTKRGMGISAMIYGDAGIGKTQIIRQSCNRRIAELGDGRELILYNDYIEKFPNIKEFEDNLKNYYIFHDVRPALLDPQIITGIPSQSSVEKYGMIKEDPIPWTKVLITSNDAAGTLFLDEINQAPPEVQNALFSILNFEEREVAGKSIKGNWRIHAAGNWGPAYTINDLSLALSDRLLPYYLKASYKDWKEWADKATLPGDSSQPLIHPILMEFIASNPKKYFFQTGQAVGNEATGKGPSPRNHAALSILLYQTIGSPDQEDIEITQSSWNEVMLSIGAMYGKKIASEFEAFFVQRTGIELEDIIADPRMIDTRYHSLSDNPYDEDVAPRAANVFKTSLEKLVRTFSTDFDKSKEPEKRRLVEKAVGAIYVLATLLEIDKKQEHLKRPAEKIFMDAFQAIPQRYKIEWNAMMSDCEKYLAEVGLDEASKQVVDFNRKLVASVVGIAKSGTSGGATKKPTKFEVEDNEEETDTSVSPRTLSLVQAVNDGRGIPLERFQQLMSNLNI